MNIRPASFDSQGRQLFLSRMDQGSNSDYVDVRDLKLDPAGRGLYLVGDTRGDFDGNRHIGPRFNQDCNGFDVFIARFGLDGRRLWSRLFGVPDASENDVKNDYAAAVAVDRQDHLDQLGILSGGSMPALDAELGDADATLSRLSPTGKPLWSVRFGTPRREHATGIAAGIAQMVRTWGDAWRAVT